MVIYSDAKKISGSFLLEQFSLSHFATPLMGESIMILAFSGHALIQAQQ
jgi:hypothetical protein